MGSHTAKSIFSNSALRYCICKLPGGKEGTLGISQWGCAARTLEPLALYYQG